ncbi:hypothetical protein ACIRG5_12490 [Lentzea sp. NPDC102401]|uniref:hypothetical protein n=1 Tax=Lentzea sp. NPDC102401 TaxID=3364128 RepID=UPI00380DB3BE
MTGMERVPMGPPWSVDLIADLHAGVLPPEVAAQLRPRVEADAEAREILQALDATLMDLQSLPPVAMPDHVAARIDAALAAEARPGIAPVVSLNDARKRRNRRLGLGGGVLVAAAAAFGIVLAVSPGSQTPTNDSAQPPQATSKPTSADLQSLTKAQLGSAVGEVLKAQNYGPLETPDRLAGCLQGGGITSSGNPLGISPVNLEGKDAVMAILPAGIGKYRLVVLDPATCGPDKPEGVLADTTVGQR